MSKNFNIHIRDLKGALNRFSDRYEKKMPCIKIFVYKGQSQ